MNLEVSETDDQIMERMRERFEILEDMTKACKAGKVRALIVSGAPGVGKSFGVEKVLSGHDLFATIAQDESLRKYEVVKGAITELGLYAKLYEFKNDKHILVFDDCDTIFSSELSLNILKAALDTSAKRMIHWNADSHKLRGEGIPNKFEFCGSVIFITNVNFNHIRSKKIKGHLDALSSRCHFIDLTVHTMREKLLRIQQIVGDGMLDNHNLTDDIKEEVVSFVLSNTATLNELSLRTVIKCADLASAFPTKWQRTARITLMK